MIFPYLEITPEISRPIIPLIIKSDSVVILYSGLIDSGADYCTFSSEIGSKLGFISEKKNEMIFFGAGKDQIRVS